MKTALRRWLTAGIAAGLFTVVTGCVSTEGEVGVSYGADYYDTYGYDYGYWRPGYYVAPPRGERRERESRERATRSETAPSRPTYRPAPPSRPAPSIPLRPRSH